MNRNIKQRTEKGEREKEILTNKLEAEVFWGKGQQNINISQKLYLNKSIKLGHK